MEKRVHRRIQMEAAPCPWEEFHRRVPGAFRKLAALMKPSIVPMSGESGPKTEFERASVRHQMLLSLLGSDSIEEVLTQFFPSKLSICSYALRFHSETSPSWADYANFMGGVDRIYNLLLTFIGRDYFYQQWLIGRPPKIRSEHRLIITSIQFASPGELYGTGVREVTSALRDVLSIGKQVEDFRMAGIHVEEAKLELEKKRTELEAAKREQVLKGEVRQLELEVERAKKQLELEQLRTQRDAELRKRRKLFLEDLEAHFEILMIEIRVLERIPEEMRDELKAALQAELELLRDNPLSIDTVVIKDTDCSETKKP